MEEALYAMADTLGTSGAGASADTVYEALHAREQMHSTALGEGVAAPHATIEGVTDPVMLIATGAAPIPFGPEDADPVRLFFVLLSPPSMTGQHIRMLARIARLVRRPGLVDELVGAATADELLDRLAAAEPQLS